LKKFLKPAWSKNVKLVNGKPDEKKSKPIYPVLFSIPVSTSLSQAPLCVLNFSSTRPLPAMAQFFSFLKY